MRRSFEDFAAEVYKRRDGINEKRKRRAVFLNRLAPIALCFVLSFSTLIFIMPILLKGNQSKDEDADFDSNQGVMDDEEGSDVTGGTDYIIEISYITVYTEAGRTVYNDADDIWDVFLYVEDYPEDFEYSKSNPKTGDGAYYKVMVCLRDGTTSYYLLDELGDEEVIAGFQALMESLSQE